MALAPFAVSKTQGIENDGERDRDIRRARNKRILVARLHYATRQLSIPLIKISLIKISHRYGQHLYVYIYTSLVSAVAFVRMYSRLIEQTRGLVCTFEFLFLSSLSLSLVRFLSYLVCFPHSRILSPSSSLSRFVCSFATLSIPFSLSPSLFFCRTRNR